MITIVNSEPDPSVLREVICQNCGITLSYLPIDTLTQKLSCMGESEGSYKYIECLGCAARIEVEDNRL
jgi:hypothetical protein